LIIADLTNKNDIRRFTKRAPQPGGKRAGITPDLSLREIRAIVGELIFDGILDRHDMAHLILVYPLKQGRDGGGFPGAGWSRQKNQAVRASAPSGQEPLRRSQGFQAWHVGLDAAHDRSEAAHGAVQAHAVPRLSARDEATVAVHVAVALRVPAAGLPEGCDIRERQGFFVEHTDLFIDLKPRYLVLLEENVARLPLLRGVEDAVDSLLHASQLLLRRRISGKCC